MSNATATLAAWEFRGAARSRWVLGTAVAFAALCLAVCSSACGRCASSGSPAWARPRRP